MLVAGIGLGSNLGDRAATLRSAVESLARVPGITGVTLSPIYETAPIGPPQPDYLNAAARVETTLDPEPLLDALLAIERAHGRERRDRWGPRTLDLDILALWDPIAHASRTHDAPRLRVPHPHLHERAFALAPLLDVIPELAPIFAGDLASLGGSPPRWAPREEGSQSVVVPERHR
jgi:2-amino-4-hydroxy-6-hydroxymethyldihydropteridine diphosphokinase